jgi:hypothetical protein
MKIMFVGLGVVVSAVMGWSAPAGDIGQLAYDITFAQGTPALPTVEQFVKLAGQEPHLAKLPLPKKGDILGGLMVFKYRTGLETLAQTMITKNKSAIYKSTIFDYRNSLTDQQIISFLKQEIGELNFVSYYKVYGKYGTRFSYSMQTSIIKQHDWIMEREWTQGEAEEIRGIGGYIKELCYTILVARTGPDCTIRAVASWSDAGGDIPLVGKITPSYNDIYEGIITGYKDVLNYLRLPEWQAPK